jgi:peptidyl-prolyl cis-trans isomerase D
MVEAFDEAQFSTEPGTITDHVVETSFGYHVIRVDGRREGDVPEDEAKREVAEQLYQRARAGEMAREEADRAMAYLREGHTPQELDQRLAWSWQDPPAPGADGTAPEPPERDTFAPQLRESRSFGRTEGAIAGATGSGELTRAIFEMEEDDPLPDEPIQLGDDWYVYRLRERTRATDEGFTEETRQRIHDELLEEKRAEVLRAYVDGLREAAEEAGELRINEEMLEYGDEETEEEGEEEEGEDEDEEEEDDEPAEPEEESALPPARSRGRAA